MEGGSSCTESSQCTNCKETTNKIWEAWRPGVAKQPNGTGDASKLVVGMEQERIKAQEQKKKQHTKQKWRLEEALLHSRKKLAAGFVHVNNCLDSGLP